MPKKLEIRLTFPYKIKVHVLAFSFFELVIVSFNFESKYSVHV